MSHMDNPKVAKVGTYIDVPVPEAVGVVEDFSKVPTILVAASDATDKVKQYADYVCTGSNDNVTIENAINSLPTAGGRVKLSEGTFTFSSSLDILKSNVSLEGSGPATVIKGAISTSYIIVGDGSTSISNVKISNLRIDGTDQTGGYGIYFKGASGYEIKYSVVINCWIINCYDGGIYSSYFRQGKIINNLIINVAGVGLKNDYIQESIIANNLIYITSATDGIFNSSGYRCVISNNIIYDPGRMGIHNAGGSYSVIKGNIIFNSTHNGIESYSDYCSIAGNVIYDPYFNGVDIGDGNYNSVSSNTIYSAGNYGIRGDGGSNNVIVGNFIDGASDSIYGIYLVNGSGDVVVSNRVYGCLTNNIYVSKSNSIVMGNLEG